MHLHQQVVGETSAAGKSMRSPQESVSEGLKGWEAGSVPSKMWGIRTENTLQVYSVTEPFSIGTVLHGKPHSKFEAMIS